MLLRRSEAKRAFSRTLIGQHNLLLPGLRGTTAAEDRCRPADDLDFPDCVSMIVLPVSVPIAPARARARVKGGCAIGVNSQNASVHGSILAGSCLLTAITTPVTNPSVGPTTFTWHGFWSVPHWMQITGKGRRPQASAMISREGGEFSESVWRERSGGVWLVRRKQRANNNSRQARRPEGLIYYMCRAAPRWAVCGFLLSAGRV